MVAIDMHRGHLDPLGGQRARGPRGLGPGGGQHRPVAWIWRGPGMPVIHVVLTYRKYPSPAVERMASAFKRALDTVKMQMLNVASTIREHNVEGSPADADPSRPGPGRRRPDHQQQEAPQRLLRHRPGDPAARAEGGHGAHLWRQHQHLRPVLGLRGQPTGT